MAVTRRQSCRRCGCGTHWVLLSRPPPALGDGDALRRIGATPPVEVVVWITAVSALVAGPGTVGGNVTAVEGEPRHHDKTTLATMGGALGMRPGRARRR